MKNIVCNHATESGVWANNSTTTTNRLCSHSERMFGTVQLMQSSRKHIEFWTCDHLACRAYLSSKLLLKHVSRMVIRYVYCKCNNKFSYTFILWFKIWRCFGFTTCQVALQSEFCFFFFGNVYELTVSHWYHLVTAGSMWGNYLS
jgi:hypothetical protein